VTAADAPDDRADRERISARRATWAFFVTALAAGGLTAVYALGGDPQLEGALIGVTFGSLGIGCVLIAKGLLPDDPHAEARHDFGGDDDGSGTLGAGAEQARADADAEELAFEDDFMRVAPLTRRRLLRTALLAAGAAIAAAAVFPIRSLGPDPGRSLLVTPWRAGRRAVTEDGHPVRADDVPVGGLVTIFPEGHPDSADGQAVLVRVRPHELAHSPGPRSWTPDGLIAFSKVCTHAGCPVGLYQAQSHQLLCPCHQSLFDVLDGARPVLGPAARALPQLPLAIDDAGFVVARRDFTEPIGPAWWSRP
jgi:ubiquinol-cytochrome c reductase iron-sulfur subunit